MVSRDFRESTKQKYLHDVDQVCADQGSRQDKFWDGVGKFPGIGWLINEGIKVFQGQDEYESHLIDINNTTRQQIQQIWDNVNGDARGYMTKFAATGADIDGFTNQLKALTDTIKSKGSFTAANINGKLKAGVNDYINIEKYLAEIAGKGLDVNTATKDPHTAVETLKAIAQFALDHSPSLKANETWTMDLGGGLLIIIGFHVSDYNGGKGTITLDIPDDVFENEKLRLRDMLSASKNGIHIDTEGRLDTNGWVSDNNNNGVDFDQQTGTITGSWHKTDHGQTEKVALKFNFNTHELTITSAVEDQLPNGTTSTDITMQTTKDFHWHIPNNPPAPVTVTDPVVMKALDRIKAAMANLHAPAVVITYVIDDLFIHLLTPQMAKAIVNMSEAALMAWLIASLIAAGILDPVK
ncbi:hypothetical protein OZX62_00095 [Bifidobacterium sp. ESL0690]|uniref:hypothetical protein n=1 Tax=Bifidobacterium sp. ESL0690 TaxID=2983214 RepID=UPI0023F80FF0|nr:hypothetical protein [Bifidobacterium sp. ESL0690]WEV46752.1 hypothetical protein OZX62_00095 [Bifidobacterium sp. ESL0690]